MLTFGVGYPGSIAKTFFIAVSNSFLHHKMLFFSVFAFVYNLSSFVHIQE
jgi:hypothetical protein